MKKIITLSILAMSCMLAQNLLNDSGVPIRQGIHIEWFKTVSPGEDGTAIFVWSDNRFGQRDIFAQKIDSDGTLLWGEGGAVVTDLPGRQEDPVSIADGNGGVFIAWIDYRFDASGDVFYQHIDTNGNRLVGDNGVALAQVASKQISINMCTDSLGGVFVTWQDKRNLVDDDIYGTHISADHTVIAPGVGVSIVSAGGGQSAKSIEYAGNNEAFIAWADARNGGNMDIYGQRLDIAMNPLMDIDGVSIASTDASETRPRVTYMDNNRSFVIWKSEDEGSEILYQLMDINGFLLTEPYKISQNTASQLSPRIKRNGVGEVFVSWTDLRLDALEGDLFFQKIALDGTVLWGEGIALEQTDNPNGNGRFSADSSGGLFVVWERGTFPNMNIFLQHYDVNGNPLLGDGETIADEFGNQDAPNLIVSPQNGIFTIYSNQMSGSAQLYVDGMSDGNHWGSDVLGAIGMDGDARYTQGFNVSSSEAILFWEDSRFANKIYANRAINEALSHSNGTKVTYSDDSASEDDQTLPVYHTDENNFYIATFDGSDFPKSARINKLNANFENMWGDSGVAIQTTNDQSNGRFVSVENGIGYFWSQYQSIYLDVFYQRFDENGNPLFATGGKAILEHSVDKYLQKAVNTPDNQIMLFWLDNAWHNARLKAKKINLDGDLAIGWPANGYDVSSGVYEIHDFSAKIISDEIGIFAVWRQTTGAETEIYGQIIDWNGNVTWASGGLSLSNVEHDQLNPSMDVDTLGKTAFVTWEDFRNGTDFNIHGQEIDLENGILTGESVQFSADTTQQLNAYVKNISENKYLILWEDGRGFYSQDPLLTGGTDLYGSGYEISAGMSAEMDGFPFVLNYHEQSKVQVTDYDQNGQFLMHWIDLRSSGKADIYNYYGMIIESADYLGVSGETSNTADQFKLHSAYPNPFNGSIQFEFEMTAFEPVQFSIYDLSGRKVSERLILPSPSGNYRISWNGKDINGKELSSGIYFYQFIARDIIIKDKMTYIK